MSPGMQMALTIITSVLASGGLWAFIQNAVIKHQENRSAVAEGVQCLLRYRIIAICKEQEDLGYCSEDDKTDLEHMYKAYANLGGNDVAHEYYDKVMALPHHAPTDNKTKKGN